VRGSGPPGGRGRLAGCQPASTTSAPTLTTAAVAGQENRLNEPATIA
jgi:hypothetical protein